jgi:hypothetical protein
MEKDLLALIETGYQFASRISILSIGKCGNFVRESFYPVMFEGRHKCSGNGAGVPRGLQNRWPRVKNEEEVRFPLPLPRTYL